MSVDFTLDSTLLSSPHFDLKFDKNVNLNRMSTGFLNIAPLYAPDTKVHLVGNENKIGTILHVPNTSDPVYTVAFDNDNIAQNKESDILPN